MIPVALGRVRTASANSDGIVAHKQGGSRMRSVMSRWTPELLHKRSIIGAAVAAALPLAVAAQDVGDEIVVHGYRSSLNASLSAKRESAPSAP